MKIYDCFIFRNEFELLNLRLNLLYDSVDYFVLVEANTTFTGISKPLYFDERKEEYQQYKDKIIHVKVTDMPLNANPWINEAHQRNSILRGLNTAANNDYVIISDIDEILRPQSINIMREKNLDFYGFRMPYFNFKFNYMLINDQETYSTWVVACKKEFLREPESFRKQRFELNQLGYNFESDRLKMIEHAGWHFTYLGDTDWIKTKLKSFAHSEFNKEEILNRVNVEESMKKGTGFNPDDTRHFVLVAINDYFPSGVANYPSYIVRGEFKDARTYLPK